MFGWLHRRAENLLALILGALFASFLIQIVFRYLLNLPLGWTVEFVAIAWLWGILFGYAFVVSERDVIRLDILYTLLPRNAQRTLDIITGLTCAAIFVWTLPQIWDYVTFMKIEKTAYMKIRFDWVFSIYIPFALAVILRCLITVWHAVRNTTPVPVSHIVTAETHDYD
ncbi:TRAP-type C4-dicarboxylate transport system, small permease component [Puniceibacterium sediminis]|uniref:TRAP transporter small permease protein n=1 Tax=Puniceibacterium sediminis TaxID=1608407 RepID=A0A238ZEW6_9RHOB|nr:TRAP-type C4-dicarboxylate transport system, small permease component [Puniceibacterium sediminis]